MVRHLPMLLSLSVVGSFWGLELCSCGGDNHTLRFVIGLGRGPSHSVYDNNSMIIHDTGRLT